jgi:hypothetical protein
MQYCVPAMYIYFCYSMYDAILSLLKQKPNVWLKILYKNGYNLFYIL